MLICKDVCETIVFDVLQDLIEASNAFHGCKVWELMRENLQAIIQNTRVVYRLFLSPKSRRIRCLGLTVRTLSKEKWVSISVEQRPFDADVGGE